LAHKRILCAIACAALWCSGAAAAGEASIEVPMRDPWVPPEVAKKARVEPPSAGASLEAQVDAKLHARFDAAAGPSGLLTREAAHAAGLGFIERHFDAIDRAHTGRISYADYRRFLVSRGAALP
jgi:hypothetical protein